MTAMALTKTETTLSPLPLLASRINEAHQECENSARSAIQYAVEAGRALLDAKEQVEHGAWYSWLDANCECSPRTAQRYMRVCQRLPEIEAKATRVSDLSLREGLKLLTNPNAGTLSEKMGPNIQVRNDYACERLLTMRLFGEILRWAEEKGIPNVHKLRWLWPDEGFVTEQELLEMICNLSGDGTGKLIAIARYYAGKEADYDWELTIYDITVAMSRFARELDPVEPTDEEDAIRKEDPLRLYLDWIGEQSAQEIERCKVHEPAEQLAVI